MMDKDKQREILRLEKRNHLLWRDQNVVEDRINDFKDSLSDNPTDEELDKLSELEEEYELKHKIYSDSFSELYELKKGNKKFDLVNIFQIIVMIIGLSLIFYINYPSSDCDCVTQQELVVEE